MRTNAVLKKVGMDALVAALGHVDAERFIVMINSESFDYTEWRKPNLDQGMGVRELGKKAAEYRKTPGV